MRNIEVMRNYFLGKDPQLKETLADNSLRLIGIEGKYFVVRTELLQRLKELKEYLDDKDKEMAEAIQGVINDLNAEINNRKSGDNALGTRIDNETLARQNADTALGNRVSTIEYWKNNNNFVMLDDLVTALANYYTKSEVNSLIAAIPTLTYEIVETLPTTNISTRTIYMVFQTGAQEPDFYNEYLYIGDTTQPYDPGNWELIGTTRIDLSNYYTKSEVDAMTFTRTLTQDAHVLDSSATVTGLTEGWYFTGSYAVYYNDNFEPTILQNALFYYTEGLVVAFPPNIDNGGAQLLGTTWYNYELHKWEYGGWDVVGFLDDSVGDASLPTAKVVYDAITYLGNWTAEGLNNVEDLLQVNKEFTDTVVEGSYCEITPTITPGSLNIVADANYAYGAYSVSRGEVYTITGKGGPGDKVLYAIYDSDGKMISCASSNQVASSEPIYFAKDGVFVVNFTDWANYPYEVTADVYKSVAELETEIGVIDIPTTLALNSDIDFTEYVGKYVRLSTNISEPVGYEAIMTGTGLGSQIFYVKNATTLVSTTLYTEGAATGAGTISVLSLVYSNSTWGWSRERKIVKDFVGTDGQTAGTAGLVPKPATTDAGKFLKANGTWDTPQDTTYSAFTGTDGQTAGTSGLVPAPATTDSGKFLCADGTWQTAGGGGGSTITYGTTDLTPGVSPLAEGTFYFVYE